MSLKKILLSVLMMLQLCLLIGCDYIEKASKVDDLVTQQGLQKSKIEALEEQQGLDKRKTEHFEKQQTTIINSTRMLVGVMEVVKNKQDEFVFTEFNPAQTQYFVLNNGFIGLVGKILSTDAAENGSAIHISLINLLSVPVLDMGFYAMQGGEKPADIDTLAKWQQLLFSTAMNSFLKLLSGQ